MKSIMPTEKGTCYLCKRVCDTELHHIFGNRNRKLSDKDGLTVYLCHRCHWRVHNGSESAALRYRLHVEGQEKYEETHTLEEFRARYGRNYL